MIQASDMLLEGPLRFPLPYTHALRYILHLLIVQVS